MDTVITENTTIREAIKICRYYNAGIIQVTAEAKEGKAKGAVVILDGEDTQEVLDAIEAVTKKWNAGELEIKGV